MMLAVRLAGLLAALALAAAPAGQVLAQSPSIGDAMKIRVETTDSGFVCSPADQPGCIGEQDGDFVVEVPQGQLVEMTFAWAHVGWVLEKHIIVLQGYKLETEEVHSDDHPEHREDTLQFIADKAGTFNFKCDIECDVHDYMQSGYLRVVRGGGATAAAAASFTPTELSIVPSSLVTVGDPVTLMFELRDSTGQPVPKSELALFVDAEFGGTRDKMLVGTAKTDSNGIAFFAYQPRLDVGTHAISARYEGGGIYAETDASLVLEMVGTPPPAYETALIGLEGVRAWAPLVFAGVSAAVWVALALVLLGAISVKWVRGKPVSTIPDRAEPAGSGSRDGG